MYSVVFEGCLVGIGLFDDSVSKIVYISNKQGGRFCNCNKIVEGRCVELNLTKRKNPTNIQIPRAAFPTLSKFMESDLSNAISWVIGNSKSHGGL